MLGTRRIVCLQKEASFENKIKILMSYNQRSEVKTYFAHLGLALNAAPHSVKCMEPAGFGTDAQRDLFEVVHSFCWILNLDASEYLYEVFVGDLR